MEKWNPKDYGLSDSLSERLLAWAEYRNSHYDHESSWDDPKSQEKSRQEGDVLVVDLHKEVGHFADVVDER